MPVIISDNEQRSGHNLVRESGDQKYDYPMRLNLKPDSKLHGDLVAKIMERALESSNVMAKRYKDWKKIDEMLTAYIRPSNEAVRAKQKNKHSPLEIVVPQSYATLEVLLTYMTAALLDDTIFQYEGRSPEDIVGAILLERIVDMQMYHTKSHLALHTAFRDAFAYGFGLVSPAWTEEYTLVSKKMPAPRGILDILVGRQQGFIRQEVEELIFEGNEVVNIDPYLALPDPNVSIDRIQDGEFFGWVDKTNYKNLLTLERHNENYFNVRYLDSIKGNSGTSRLYKGDSSGRGQRSGISNDDNNTLVSTGRIDVIKMYCDIIPRDWKLPGGPGNRNGSYPETWYFEVAGDVVVIRCQRLGLNHGKKPVAAIAPDFDGYSISPISRMEIIQGMQSVTNFLFNSHIANVRKCINDILVFDPSLIEAAAINDPSPGKRIPLRKTAWGRGVKDAVFQLQVNDITRANIQDAEILGQYTKDISGAVDSMSGIRRKTSERVTAQEVQGDRFGAVSRLEKMAKIIGWMGMRDLSYMIASHTQQFMKQETYVKITGQWQDLLVSEYGVDIRDSRVKVSPFDLLIGYDIISRDGSIPGGNFSQIWTQMLPTLMGNQELLQRFDIVRIVKHIMRNAGAKDVDQFDRRIGIPPISANIQSEENVQKEVDAGNLVPAMEGM